MNIKMKVLAVMACVLCAPLQMCLADSIHLQFNEAGTMYYDTSYTTSKGVITSSGALSAISTPTLYDGLGTTLEYSTGTLFGNGASGTFSPTPSAWILKDSSGLVSDLVVFSTHTIFIFDAAPKEPGDSTFLNVLPTSKTNSSGTYDLTDPNQLATYLGTTSVAIPSTDISIVTEHYVSDTILSGNGYQIIGMNGGPGAMKYDGVTPIVQVPTTITFASDPVPLPSEAVSGVALIGLLIARRRISA